MKSFSERTDLNVFERHAKGQFIRTPECGARELFSIVRDFCAGSHSSVLGEYG